MDKTQNHIINDVQYLEHLARKRKGGSGNIRGIALQIIYSTFRILHYFSEVEHHQIQLEGLEDIDIEYPLPSNKIEIVQIKHSEGVLTPAVFWNKGILLHFLDVHLNNKIKYSFRLVYDMSVKHRHLENLFSGNIDSITLDYWSRKILKSEQGKSLTKSDCVSFLKLIFYEKINIPKLYTDSEDLLTQYYGVTDELKSIYFRILLTNVFLWSAQRKLINDKDLLQLLNEISGYLSTARANEAIEKHWLHNVTFSVIGREKSDEYLEDRSAKPYHISAGLPVKRPEYLKRIEIAFENKDVILIKGTSGQGKSTLAWQTCMNLANKKMSIYELKLCNHEDHLSALSRFVEAKVKEMERLVIVIDGLNKQVDLWHILTDRMCYLPVKFIITCNQEDWRRHTIDTTKMRLATIDISLTQSEAKDIYTSLKKNKRLKSRKITWQEAWSKISERGLLMEYIYLLTNGNIIEERLHNQIQRISQEMDGAIMLEIIRLTSIADICNVKISKSHLWDYILSQFTPSKDRDQIFNQLSLEYLISIDDSYLRGLHFVRSEHLVKILHHTISVKRSYLNVLALLEKKLILEFLTNLPFDSASFIEPQLLTPS